MIVVKTKIDSHVLSLPEIITTRPYSLKRVMSHIENHHTACEIMVVWILD
jgi:hypothetical protein